MAFHQPLDLEYWFLQVFAGTTDIFMAIAFLTIGLISGKFGFPNVITFSAFSLFVIMLANYALGLSLLIVIILGLGIGIILARIFR